MPAIRLPDGSVRNYDGPVTAAQVAADIGPGLAKAALGARIDGELCDLGRVIDSDAAVAIVTPRERDGTTSADALYLLRHSCAHVMAEAIQRVVPGVLLVYGPPVENGFYYDMAVPEERPLSTEDFEAIEREMARIIEEDRPFTRYELDREDGLRKLQAEGSKYKLDNAERALEAGSDRLSFYATGEPGSDWEDLCAGPHAPSSGRIGAFKVMSLAASYWHGDADSDRLTRVYGTAFPDKKQLKVHLDQLAEARKRDHRIVGKKMGIFTLSEKVGQGLALWKPAGAAIRRELEEFVRVELERQGYQQVYTPHIGKLVLYRTSGHYPYYRESQYPPIVEPERLRKLADENASCGELANLLEQGEVDGYLLRPMNCPHHIQIYSSEPRSYRDLPVRLAEFGTVYRWEQSGEIGGLTRVRCFTVDDAHLFCTPDQVAEEVAGCLHLVKLVFSTLGLADFRVRVGLRDPDSSKYVGDSASWDRAEEACRAAAKDLGVAYSEEAGEAAFYGPKIDFMVKDVIGREWQLGTVQVDYNLPERFDLEYTGADGVRHRPVMIHRAPFGSLERFVGVLIEHYGGAFPTWLAPEQVRVLPISDKSSSYADEVYRGLRDRGVRASVDRSKERIQGKVRNASEMKIPYQLVVGPRDAENREVSVRARGVRKDLGALGLDAFLDGIQAEIASRGASTVLQTHFPEAAS